MNCFKKKLLLVTALSSGFIVGHGSHQKGAERLFPTIVSKPYAPWLQEVLQQYNIPDTSALQIRTTDDKYASFFMAGFGGYAHSIDAVGYCSSLENEHTEAVKKFFIAHELAHRKYCHGQVSEGLSWMTCIGSFLYGVTRSNRRMRIVGTIGAWCAQKVGNRWFNRVCEKHADLIAAQKVGCEKGIGFMNQLQVEESNFQFSKFGFDDEEIKNFKDFLNSHPRTTTVLLTFFKILDTPLLRTHPTTDTRLAYLEKYKKTGHLPFMYRLPDLLPFWPKNNN